MRMYDFEWLIAEQLNGNRRIDEVASYARERLGIQPTAADIEAYVAKLAELGFLDETAAAVTMEAEEEEVELTPLPSPVPASASTPPGGTPAIPEPPVGTAPTMIAQ